MDASLWCSACATRCDDWGMEGLVVVGALPWMRSPKPSVPVGLRRPTPRYGELQLRLDVNVGVGPESSLRRGSVFDKGGSKEWGCKGECVSSLDWVWLKGACGAMAS